ncbi:MAG: NADPH-dependent F420 reductase, partial [Gammaproteobacteria bacterium]|nr:NADPH-dependent F420 reductase [Gammaproteobacteria bacterium]
AQAGNKVIIGSRDAERAAETAADINSKLDKDIAEGMDNLSAAEAGEIVVLTIKFNHQRSTLEQLHDAVQGKIVVDTTVPLVPPKVARVQLPPEGSASIITQQILGENVRVVSAFQNIAADSLPGDAPINCDVLVTGDKKDAREAVVQVARASGMRAWHAGPIANSVAAEAMTSLLIHLNKQFPGAHTGIKITGIPD